MRKRNAVRALILSPDNQILLARMWYKETADLWLTPGGGIEDNEDPMCALKRELNEEIFDRDWPIGQLVWTREHSFVFEGSQVCQREAYYLLRTDKFIPPTKMPDQHEDQYFRGYKWWDLEDILLSEEIFVPKRIGFYLSDLIKGFVPDTPIDVGV